MLRDTAARALSIIGHPALLMPAAIVGITLSEGAPAATVARAAGASLAVAGAVLAYSVLRVRSGAWAHPDASRPGERLQLNLFLLVTLLAVTALSYSLSRPRAVTFGALLCAGIIAVALLLRARLKVSLHVAFEVTDETRMPVPGATGDAATRNPGFEFRSVVVTRPRAAERNWDASLGFQDPPRAT